MNKLKLTTGNGGSGGGSKVLQNEVINLQRNRLLEEINVKLQMPSQTSFDVETTGFADFTKFAEETDESNVSNSFVFLGKIGCLFFKRFRKRGLMVCY